MGARPRDGAPDHPVSLRETLADLSAERRALRATGLSPRYVVWWQTEGGQNVKHLKTIRATVARWSARDTAKHTRIFVLQKERCYLCGHRMAGKPAGGGAAGDKYTRDHVNPKFRGGKDHENILLAHQPCNLAKGNRKPHPCELIFLEGVNLRLHAQERRAKR